MTVPPTPAPTEHPIGIDVSWRLPGTLRPAVRDLPALAWLASRRCTGGPDVDRYRAAAALPVWLVVLAVQHATGTLAARGRDAFLVLTPTWPAARRSYRSVKTGALAGGTFLALPLAMAAYVLLWALGAAGLALGVARHAVVVAELVLPALILAVWGIGLAAHPYRRVLLQEVRRWAAARHTAAETTGRTVLATSLYGRGRPSIAAGRLGGHVLELADARGWALLTNGGVLDHTARQYAAAGFVWLPDSTRRMLRTATAGPAPVDVAGEYVAQLAARVGVRVDEVRLVDAAGASAGRTWGRGRTLIAVPARYLVDGEVPPACSRAAIAHEIGHHALGHFTSATRLTRVGRKVIVWAVLVLTGALVLVVTQQAALVTGVALVTVAGMVGAGWLCDRPVRRQEYEADAFAVDLVGAGDVIAQLRGLQQRAQDVGRLSRRLERVFAFTHPPLDRRLERVLHCSPPAGSGR